MGKGLADRILQIIRENGAVSTSGIKAVLDEDYRFFIDKAEINSLLYGQLREFVIRDKNETGYPIWRLKGNSFEASAGLEVMFFRELVEKNICSDNDSQLNYQIRNIRNNKIYHLDIVIFQNGKKFNIEIDGFEHIRADARLSIQKQIEKNGGNREISIDWMDNETSFADFKKIDSEKVFKWCIKHGDWCIRYHEELLKPHDITRNIFLIENGWKVIRFWNFEIKNEIEQCARIVKNWIS